MTNNKLLCLTLEPELDRLKTILCGNRIIHSWRLKMPTEYNATGFCVYEVFVKEDDLGNAGELLRENGYAVWVRK